MFGQIPALVRSAELCVATAEKQLEADPAAAELHPDAPGRLFFPLFTLRPVLTQIHISCVRIL